MAGPDFEDWTSGITFMDTLPVGADLPDWTKGVQAPQGGGGVPVPPAVGDVLTATGTTAGAYDWQPPPTGTFTAAQYNTSTDQTLPVGPPDTGGIQIMGGAAAATVGTATVVVHAVSACTVQICAQDNTTGNPVLAEVEATMAAGEIKPIPIVWHGQGSAFYVRGASSTGDAVAVALVNTKPATLAVIVS